MPYNPLYIYYEDDLIGEQNQQNTANRIFDWLEISPHEVGTKFVKTNTFQLSDLVINYEEMIGSIKGTPFEKFI